MSGDSKDQIFMTVEKQYMGWYDDKEHEFSIGTAIFKLLLKRFGNTLNLRYS